MTKYTKIAAPMAMAIAMGIGSASYAQEPRVVPKDPTPSRPPISATVDNMRATQEWERRHRASKIIGADVHNRQNEAIGEIEDIVLDRNGNVAYAVVSTGGFLGIGDRQHAVPWKSLQPRANEDGFMLDMDRKRLQAAPGFPKTAWPNFNDERWDKDNRRAYPMR